MFESLALALGLAAASSMIPVTNPAPNLTPIVAIDEDTNSVFVLHFAWNYSSPVTVQYFKLWIGPSPGFYTRSIILSNGLAYSFIVTNWPEEFVRHFYAVTAVNLLGWESPYSNEVFFPLYPDDHWLLSWLSPSPATIVTFPKITDPRSAWVVFARTAPGVTNITGQITGQTLLFSLYRTNGPPDTLTMTSFNPMNK